METTAMVMIICVTQALRPPAGQWCLMKAACSELRSQAPKKPSNINKTPTKHSSWPLNISSTPIFLQQYQNNLQFSCLFGIHFWHCKEDVYPSMSAYLLKILLCLAILLIFLPCKNQLAERMTSWDQMLRTREFSFLHKRSLIVLESKAIYFYWPVFTQHEMKY